MESSSLDHYKSSGNSCPLYKTFGKRFPIGGQEKMLEDWILVKIKDHNGGDPKNESKIE